MSCPAAFASIATDADPRYKLDIIENRFWHTNTTLYIKLNSAPTTPVKVNVYLSTTHPVTGEPTRILFRPNVSSLVFTAANWTTPQPVRYIIDPKINNKIGLDPDYYDIKPTVVFDSGKGPCYRPPPPPVSITTRLNSAFSDFHSYYALFSWWY